MMFSSSPSEDSQLLLEMNCEVFEQDSKATVHYFMDPEFDLTLNKSTDETAN